MAKKKKPEISLEDQLGITGTENAAQLYLVYVRHYTSNSKLTDKARQLWKKKYYEEKGK